MCTHCAYILRVRNAPLYTHFTFGMHFYIHICIRIKKMYAIFEKMYTIFEKMYAIKDKMITLTFPTQATLKAFPTVWGRGTACGGGGLRRGMAQAEQPEHTPNFTQNSLPHTVGEGDRLRWRRAAVRNRPKSSNQNTRQTPHQTAFPAPWGRGTACGGGGLRGGIAQSQTNRTPANL